MVMCSDRTAAFAALLVAVVLTVSEVAGAQPAAPPVTSSPPPAPGVPVTVAPAVKRDVPILLGNIGSVQAFQTVLIRVRVDGTLQEIFFQAAQAMIRSLAALAMTL